MRITFICGCLNPGHDGVGDYTRKLAEQLSQLGHECQLIALKDTEDSQETRGHLQIFRHVQVLNDTETSTAVRKQIKAWNPDWISLQFVCFSFHPKGFIHRLTPFIHDIRATAELHVMFHELWVGEQPSLPLKLKVMGLIQRQQMLNAMKRWKPDVIHTSNPLYQFVLKQHNYSASILPLFSNIELSSTEEADTNTASNQRTLLFPFSQRHDWNITETLERLASLSHKAGVSLRLIQIGTIRSGSQHWSKIQSFCAAEGWPCKLLGPQDEATLSRHMHDADIGISSAHITLAGKSGAVAAMCEHGLPVICTTTASISKRFKPAPNHSHQLYSFFDSDERLVELFRNPPRTQPNPMLSAVAEQFIADLTTTA